MDQKSRFKKIIDKIVEFIHKLADRVKTMFYSQQTLHVPLELKKYLEYATRVVFLDRENADALVDEANTMLKNLGDEVDHISDKNSKTFDINRLMIEKVLSNTERYVKSLIREMQTESDASGKLTEDGKMAAMMVQVMQKRLVIIQSILIMANKANPKKAWDKLDKSEKAVYDEINKHKQRTLESFISYCDGMMIEEGCMNLV